MDEFCIRYTNEFGYRKVKNCHKEDDSTLNTCKINCSCDHGGCAEMTFVFHRPENISIEFLEICEMYIF